MEDDLQKFLPAKNSKPEMHPVASRTITKKLEKMAD